MGESRIPGKEGEGPVSWEEFVALEEDDQRELVDGWLVQTGEPEMRHEHIVATFAYYLVTWVRRTASGGRVLASGYKVRVGDRSGVMPDLQYFARGTQTHPIALSEGRPDLAVEIVSPGRGSYDRVRKLEWYRSIGVPEYWIVDPEERSLHRYMLVEGGWRLPEALGDDAVFKPDSFPGLEIPLAELWNFPDEAPAT